MKSITFLALPLLASAGYSPTCSPSEDSLNQHPWKWMTNYNETLPADYSQCGDVWFLLVQDYKNYNDAQNYCTNLGGQLASVLSQEENDFLVQQYQWQADPYAWIGLFWPEYENYEHWVDGSCVNYMGPEGSFPSSRDPDSGYDCTGMLHGGGGEHLRGTWVHANCKEEYKPWFCEYRCPTSDLANANCPGIQTPCKN